MPQFDKITFFGQLFWFIIIFTFLFFYISYHFVPILSIYSKIQKKILKYSTKNFNYITLIKNLNVKWGLFYKVNLINSREKWENFLLKNIVLTSILNSKSLWSFFNKPQKAIFIANLKLNIKNKVASFLLTI